MNNTFQWTELGKFLTSHKATDKNYTHTHMYGACGGNFNIVGDDIETFYDLYYDYIFNQGGQTTLTETNSTLTCVKIDLDFKYNSNKIERRYTQKHVEDIVRLYIESLDQWILTSDENQRHCFVMEKTGAKLDKHLDEGEMAIKDGIHIMFPYIVSKPNIQLYIRDNILKKCSELFSDINVINSTADIFDRSVISSNGWFLYKSIKPNNYTLT